MSYYEEMEVQTDATLTQIKNQYRKLALFWHPDKNPDRVHEATEKFKRINEAYECLRDSDRRQAYDFQRRLGCTSSTQFASGRTSAEIFASFFGEETEDAKAKLDEPAIELVAPWRVFNLPIFEGYLILDIRPLSLFQQGHIVTSIHFSVTEVEQRALARTFAILIAAVEDLNGAFENLRQIVLLDAEASSLPEAPAGEAMRVAELLWALARSPTFANEVFGQNCTFRSRLPALKSVWILRTGFEGFCRVFPGLCGPSIFSAELPPWMYTRAPSDGEVSDRSSASENPCCLESELCPMPHFVLAGLYLGSAAMPHTSASLGRFGVTHCIVSRQNHLFNLDSKVRLPHVHYLELDVDAVDDASAGRKLQPVWDAACAFIAEALQCSGVVLVNVLSRSTSAGLILRFLMRSHCLSARAAALMLREVCPNIHWGYAYLDGVEDQSQIGLLKSI
jgi:hypothetical protein